MKPEPYDIKQDRKAELETIMEDYMDIPVGEETEEDKRRVNEANKEYQQILAQEGVEKYHKRKARKKIDKRWKKDEDWVNEQFGLKRLGHMLRGLSVPDGVNEIFSVGVTNKLSLKQLDKELMKLESQTIGGRTPAMACILKDKPRMEGLWVMRIRSAKELHGKYGRVMMLAM